MRECQHYADVTLFATISVTKNTHKTNTKIMKISVIGFIVLTTYCEAFIASSSTSKSSTALNGLFDKFTAGGSGNSKESLDEEWAKQQEILKFRRSSTEERAKYFEGVEARRAEASQDQRDKWAWQTKQYKKGEDPIDEWKKRRASGQISNLDDQYGDEKSKGGIPMPMASFGVPKFDNGGRFDLRLPYAEQGYVDEESDIGTKLSNFFGMNKKNEPKEVETVEVPEPAKKKNWFGQ
jgi:hypothetical protein